MLNTHLFLAFVLAVTVLMLIPGPNVALIVANSVTYGFRYGLLTVAGTSSAMILQLGLTVLGMTELLGPLGAWFETARNSRLRRFATPTAIASRKPPKPPAPRAI